MQAYHQCGVGSRPALWITTKGAVASDQVYQFLAQGRWFSPGTVASSTTKTDRHDIAEILLEVALTHHKSNQIFDIWILIAPLVSSNSSFKLLGYPTFWSWACLMSQCCSVCTKLDINVNIILTLVDIKSAFSLYFWLHFNVLTICFIIPPQRSCRGGGILVSPCPSVRPPVCRQIQCRTITWVVFLRIF